MQETPSTPNVPPQASTQASQVSSQSKSAPVHFFSKSEAIKFGFNFFKANVSVFIKLAAVVIVVNVVLSIVSNLLKGNPLSFVWMLVSIALYVVIQVGFTKIFLDFYDGKPLSLSYLYSLYPLALKYLGASILYGLIVTTGFILLIIPGIILAIRLQFYMYLVVDRGLGPINAIKGSWNITRGVGLSLFVFGILLGLVYVAGLLALVVGLLAAIPIVLMAHIYVYRKLLSQTPSIA